MPKNIPEQTTEVPLRCLLDLLHPRVLDPLRGTQTVSFPQQLEAEKLGISERRTEILGGSGPSGAVLPARFDCVGLDPQVPGGVRGTPFPDNRN